MRWPLRSRATARPEGKSRPEGTVRPGGKSRPGGMSCPGGKSRPEGTGRPEDARRPDREGSAEDVARPFGQWRALPALARVLGSQPTADSRGFVRTLPSRWQQAAVLAPLGHDVTARAPGGLVSGLGRGLEPSISGPAARQRPVPAPGDLATATGPTPIDNGLPRPSRFRLARPHRRSAAPLPGQARPGPEPVLQGGPSVGPQPPGLGPLTGPDPARPDQARPDPPAWRPGHRPPSQTR